MTGVLTAHVALGRWHYHRGWPCRSGGGFQHPHRLLLHQLVRREGRQCSCTPVDCTVTAHGLQGSGVLTLRAWRRGAQVMEGVQEGTLFDRDVVDNMSSRAASRAPSDAGDDVAAAATCASRELAHAARSASRALQALPTQARPPRRSRCPSLSS